MFNEICIYEAKIEKQDEIEQLMKEVADFYMAQDGVVDVKYIKRTHRQIDFNAVKEGAPPCSPHSKCRQGYLCVTLDFEG